MVKWVHMQPEMPQQQPQQPPQQYSIDYLNSITTAPPAKKISPFLLWGLIGGVLISLVLVVLFITSLGGGATDNLRQFGERLVVLETTTKDSQQSIQSSKLRSLNSSLKLVLTNANRDMQEPLEKEGIKVDVDKLSKETSSELTELTGSLEDARLNAVFDRTYSREVAFYLKKLRAQMSEIYDSTNSKSLKTVLETTDANIAPLSESFSSFNAS